LAMNAGRLNMEYDPEMDAQELATVAEFRQATGAAGTINLALDTLEGAGVQGKIMVLGTPCAVQRAEPLGKHLVPLMPPGKAVPMLCHLDLAPIIIQRLFGQGEPRNNQG